MSEMTLTWLVERGQAEGQTPTMWYVDVVRPDDPSSDYGWTFDPFKATRYASRDEAQAVVERRFTHLSEVTARAVEHAFGVLPSEREHVTDGCRCDPIVETVPPATPGPPVPTSVVLGANGAYWRTFDNEPRLEGMYSMCPNSTDNDPVVPVMTFLPVTENGESLVAALQKHKQRIQALQEMVCTCDSKHIFQAVLHDETCPVRATAQETTAEGSDRG